MFVFHLCTAPAGQIETFVYMVSNGHAEIYLSFYYVEEDCAYSHSLPGLKISALRENPSACLQLDQIEDDLHWRSVLAFGKYEEIENPEIRKRILGKLLERFPLLTPVESAIVNDA